MELRGNFPKADAIFQSGLERYTLCGVQLHVRQADDWDKQLTVVCAGWLIQLTDSGQSMMTFNAGWYGCACSSSTLSVRIVAPFRGSTGLQAKRLERKEAGFLETPDDPVRSSLAVLSVQNKTRQQQPATAAACAFALARPKRKAASNPGKENAGGLEVFVDDEFKAGKAGTKSSSVLPASGLWNKLGGFEQNR